MHTFFPWDGTPLHYTLVNIFRLNCKMTLRSSINCALTPKAATTAMMWLCWWTAFLLCTLNSSLEVKSAQSHAAKIVDYKSDPGNGFWIPCSAFMQLFIASNRANTYHFANNNNTHFALMPTSNFCQSINWQSEDNKNYPSDDFAGKSFEQMHISRNDKPIYGACGVKQNCWLCAPTRFMP